MKKTLIILKWFIITIPLGLFGIITAPIFYPLWVWSGWKVFWIWNNDNRLKEDGTPKDDYQSFLDTRGKGKETFWLKYLWHVVRNRIWNLRDWMAKVQEGDASGITEREFVIDDLTIDGKITHDGGKYPASCGLKYKVVSGQDPWQGWVGDIIDFKYSIVGESMMWFKQDSISSFRYSQCKKVKLLIFWKRWRTIKIELVKSDSVLSWKYQKLNK